MIRRLGAGVGAAVLAASGLVAGCSFLTAFVAVDLYPNVIDRIWRAPAHPPPDLDRFRRVEFLSLSGVRLAGWYGEGRGEQQRTATIILCHGWAADKRDMLGPAEALRASGFDVLLFDLHGWGESGRGLVTFGDRETEDVLGAVRFVKEQPGGNARRIGLVGFSMGAAAAIRAAARSPDIDAVVAGASYARLDEQVGRFFRRFAGPLWPIVDPPARWFGERLTGTAIGAISPLEVIGRIAPRPVLIVHGTRDRVIDVEDARRLYRAAGPPKTLWLVEGAGHANIRRFAPAPRWDARVAGFFAQHLRPGSGATFIRSIRQGLPDPPGNNVPPTAAQASPAAGRGFRRPP